MGGPVLGSGSHHCCSTTCLVTAAFSVAAGTAPLSLLLQHSLLLMEHSMLSHLRRAHMLLMHTQPRCSTFPTVGAFLAVTVWFLFVAAKSVCFLFSHL